MKQRKNAGTCRDKKEKAIQKKRIQFEEINQGVLAKEGRLKISTKGNTIRSDFHIIDITKTIQVRRTRHAGHCWRSRDELIREHTFSSYVRIRYVVLKTYLGR